MEEVYDALSQAQKHIMLKNGTFEFDSFKQCSCCCGHSVTEHLDHTDCCLSKEICICEKYIEKGTRTTMPQKQGKLPHKPLQEQLVVKDGKFTQDDEGKFMRQYGII